jgi:hypothetical protein
MFRTLVLVSALFNRDNMVVFSTRFLVFVILLMKNQISALIIVPIVTVIFV